MLDLDNNQGTCICLIIAINLDKLDMCQICNSLKNIKKYKDFVICIFASWHLFLIFSNISYAFKCDMLASLCCLNNPQTP